MSASGDDSARGPGSARGQKSARGQESARGLGKTELLGKRLRKLRKDRKLSPAEASASAGIDPQDLARIERGDSRVGLETLFRLLAAFEVDARELLSLAREEISSAREPERFRRELPG
jgi:transcriptional regulator with XRE-family HTH domain